MLPASAEGLSEPQAGSCWVAASAPWHPALLAQVGSKPRYARIDEPGSPSPGDLYVCPQGCQSLLPSGFLTQLADAGAIRLDAGPQRDQTLAGWIEDSLASPRRTGHEAAELVSDFLALGTTCWFLQSVARLMDRDDALDHDALAREVVAGALAWIAGDDPTARGRLRAAFELLTHTREKFYPVDSFLTDIVLLDPGSSLESLRSYLELRVPFTVLATARAIERLAEADPEGLARLREAVNEGWADVVGGPYDEVEEYRLPVESVLWQYRHGAETYRKYLDDRSVETWARRSFSLYPMVPQLARRMGMRYAWHVALDEGRFPVPPETKRLWESPDGATLEALMRPPVAADQTAGCFSFPAIVAKGLKTDHLATTPLAHWPDPVSGWYRDFRRSASYSPVLARWVTLSDYFHLTDRPWDLFRPTLDDYHPPSAALHAADPITRPARHARLRAQLDALIVADTWLALLSGLHAPPAQAESGELSFDRASIEVDAAETALERGQEDEARFRIEACTQNALSGVAERLGLQGSEFGSGVAAGYLVLNTLGWSRRVPVPLHDAPLDRGADGPVRAAQFTADGVWGVVDLPAHGYVWIPRSAQTRHNQPEPALRVNGRELTNEWISLELDEKTGGLRSVHRPGEPTPRLAQQLTFTGLHQQDGTADACVMRADSFEVEYGGPALGRMVSTGALYAQSDPVNPIARFRQTVTVWAGRPIGELAIELSDLHERLLNGMRASGGARLVSRWAWADAASSLKRSAWLGHEVTHATEFDSPESFLIESRHQQTTVLCGGLSRHRKHGPRMADTELLAGSESARHFTFAFVLDHEHLAQAVYDWLTPALILPTSLAPPPGREAGWFFQLDKRGVALTRVVFTHESADGRGWGVTFHLIETEGQPARCRLRLCRNPLGARLLDFQGDLIMDLATQDDAVLVDLTPRELACVEVTFGLHANNPEVPKTRIP